jgi:hypothetical protein
LKLQTSEASNIRWFRLLKHQIAMIGKTGTESRISTDPLIQRASMKKFDSKKALLLLLTAILWISCGKKNPVVSASSPKLTLLQTAYTLRGGDDRVPFVILNAGSGELSWSLTGKPEWLTVSRTSGSTHAEPDTVLLATDTNSIQFGTYQGVILIRSNGGDAEVPVTLNHTRPRIKVWLPILTFTRNLLNNKLLVYNHGGNILDWNLASKPDWIEMSRSNGRVAGTPDTLSVNAVIESLEYRNYTDKILIESNGGNAEVVVDLFFERETEIFPGVGAAGIELGNSYGRLLEVHGSPLKAIMEQPSKDELLNYLLYPDKGLTFEFLTDHMLITTDSCDRITMESPYSGITERQIGVGSLLAQVVAAYGPPRTISAADSAYVYDGITFQYNADSSFVEKIHIPE